MTVLLSNTLDGTPPGRCTVQRGTFISECYAV